MKGLLTLLGVFTFFTVMQAQEVWHNEISGKRASQIAIDNAGNVLIAGTIDYGVSSMSLTDFYVAKISAAGDSLWANAINGTFDNAEDDALCIGVDNAGNVYAAGYQHNLGGWWKDDYLLVKFDPNGNELWRKVYDGSNQHQDWIKALVVAGNGDVYISGFTHETINNSTNKNVTTLKYSSNGDSLWMHSWDSPINSSDDFEAMVLTSNNELIVVGHTVISSFPWDLYAPFIIKYDANGVVLFDSLYTTDGKNNALWGADFDASGNIYLLTSHEQTFNDGRMEITKYDSNGNQIMQTKFMPDSAWTYSEYIPKPITVDDQGNITIGMNVTTIITWPTVSEKMVAQFDAAGIMQWLDRKIDSGFDNETFLVKRDQMSNIYIARQERVEVAQFTYVDQLIVDKYDNSGNIIWSVRDDTLRNGSGGNNLQVVDLIPDASGNIYVTYSVRLPQHGTKDFIRTVKYDTSIPNTIDQELQLLPEKMVLNQNYPNPFNPVTNINFTIPESGKTILKVYNILGQEVAKLLNRNLPAGKYEVQFDATQLASGEYFYSLESKNELIVRKMIIIK